MFSDRRNDVIFQANIQIPKTSFENEQVKVRKRFIVATRIEMTFRIRVLSLLQNPSKEE